MSFIWSWAVKKAVGKILPNEAPAKDPYFETIPHEELSWYQRNGAKRKKPLPPGLTQNDQHVLSSVRSKAYQLDLAFQSCCGWRIGWGGIIGLIPWLGDLVVLYFAFQLIRKAREIDGGLPKYIETQMLANLGFDFGIGLIPIVGDLINVAYKGNTRNCLILESYLRKRGENALKVGGIDIPPRHSEKMDKNGRPLVVKHQFPVNNGGNNTEAAQKHSQATV